MTDKIVTEAMLDAGKRAFGGTELTGDDYIGRALTAAYTAMTTAQEPALDDDALSVLYPWLRHTLSCASQRDLHDDTVCRCGLDEAFDRLQAKAPETGEG